MVSTRPPISNSSSHLTKPLLIVPCAPIIFHSFACFFLSFSSLARFKYLSLFLFSLIFTLWSAGSAQSTVTSVLYFLLLITESTLLTEIKLSVCISRSQRVLPVSFSRQYSDSYADYYFTHLRAFHPSVRWCFSTDLLSFSYYSSLRI